MSSRSPTVRTSRRSRGARSTFGRTCVKGGVAAAQEPRRKSTHAGWTRGGPAGSDAGAHVRTMGGREMIRRPTLHSASLVCVALMLLGAVWYAAPATAQAPAGSIKIGLLYDHTGPLAEGGSPNCWRGAKMIIDDVNQHGGVAGRYKTVQGGGDSQAKREVALNEGERRLNVVLKEAYSAQGPDLSSLITNLRAARPDVLFHTGYNPDIVLFLRQAKEGGLRVRAYLGHGAGHSQLEKLKATIGAGEVEGFHTVDPAAAQHVDPKGLRPGIWNLTEEMVRRYRKEYGQGEIAPHVSMGFNNLWILLNDVLPRAIQKYGGGSPDAIAKAPRETDIPDGRTMLGYGVKFYPPGHRFSGQNERAFPVVDQVIQGEFQIVFPKYLTQVKPTVLLPRSSPLAVQ